MLDYHSGVRVYSQDKTEGLLIKTKKFLIVMNPVGFFVKRCIKAIISPVLLLYFVGPVTKMLNIEPL